MKKRAIHAFFVIVIFFSLASNSNSHDNTSFRIDAIPTSVDSLFFQARKNPEVIREVVKLSKTSLSTQVLIVWYITLLFLLIVVSTDFYRKRMLVHDFHPTEEFEVTKLEYLEQESGDDFILDDQELKEYQSRSMWLRRLIFLPPLLIITYWISNPFVELILSPPEGLGVRKFALLIFIGLLCASIVLMACIKIAFFNRIFKSGWMGLTMLCAIRFIIYLA